MSKVIPRDISYPLQLLRNFLLGRTHTTALRHEADVAPRTQPPPELPDGPCHEFSKNFYYMRDVRRDVQPPLDVHDDPPLLENGVQHVIIPETDETYVTPGRIYNWDGEPEPVFESKSEVAEETPEDTPAPPEEKPTPPPTS